MSSVFQKQVPVELLINLLEKICLKTESYYLFDINAYRKLIYHNYFDEFKEDLIIFYHYSAQRYITRTISFNKILVVIKQICKNTELPIKTEIKHINGVQNILLFIYYKDLEITNKN